MADAERNYPLEYGAKGAIAGQVLGAGATLLGPQVFPEYFRSGNRPYDPKVLKGLVALGSLGGGVVGAGVGTAYGMHKKHNTPPIHAVKEAGIADGLRGVGKALFDEHPLPKYQPQHPGQQTPGRLDKLNPFGTNKGVQPAYEPNRLSAALGAKPMGPHSVIAPPTPGYGTGAVNRLKTVGHQLGEIGRETVFGSPMAVNRELRASSLGGVAKNYLRSAKDFYSPGLGMLLGLGLPAASLYQAVSGNPDQRGANIGATLGGIATAPLTARLGLPGMLIQKPVQDLGAWIGGKFDPKTAGLVGRVAEAAKQNPATAALFAGAAVEGVRYLASKKNEDTTLPTRSS